MLEFSAPVPMLTSQHVSLTSIGDITLNIYKSSEKDSLDNKYSVTYYELPVYLNLESDQMFGEMTQETVDGMLEYPGAILDYSATDKYMHGYTRTLRITYNESYVSKSQIYTNGTHIVHAQCFTPILGSLNDHIDEFFDSVQLHSLMRGESPLSRNE